MTGKLQKKRFLKLEMSTKYEHQNKKFEEVKKSRPKNSPIVSKIW